MTTHDSHVSLGDLESAGVAVKYVAAVSIVRDVILRASRGELPGVPSAQVIRLNAAGEISVEGPIAADDWAVRRAAHLLDSLLPGFDAQPHLRIPGALRLVVARALETVDLPPYPSLDTFADALTRFASPDLQATVRALVDEFRAAGGARAEDEHRGPAHAYAEEEFNDAIAAGSAAPVRLEPRETTLTISDIRRARRATGVTLAQISERSQISRQLLVELEWGYMRHWPASHIGRTQLVRYARAAGLDDHLVVRTVWPLLEEAVRDRQTDVPLEVSIVPVHEHHEQPPQSTAIAPVFASIDVDSASTHREWGRKRYLAALAIPALLAIGIAPALWEHAARPSGSASPQLQGRDATRPGSTRAGSPETGVPVSGPGTNAHSSHALAPQSQPLQPAGDAATASSAARPAPVTPAPPHDTARLETPTLARASDTTLVGGPVSGIPGEGPAHSPSFASAGTALFYQAASDGKSALMRADTDSRGAVLRITSVVDDRAQNFHARLSPDGTRIAFDSDRDGERGVYVAGADGQNVRRISGDGFAAIPSWSPDGQTIAFVRAEAERPNVWNLWTADVSSGRERRLTSYKAGAPWGGSWFPDGRRIAYSHEANLVVLDLETGRQRAFNSPVAGRLVRTPAVSPDGKRVIFQVYRDGAWLLELADGTMRKVLSDPSAEDYTWAPDGRRVAYHSRSDGTWGVWVMAPR